MAISLISIKCPQCGADLSVESTKKISFCRYCGTKVILNNENEYIYHNIDEARIKEAETERMIRLRELELEEKERLRGQKSLMIVYGIALMFVLIGALICIFKPLAGAWGIMIGFYIALFTIIKSEDKKKKNRRKYVGANEVLISEAMTDCAEKNYNNVIILFKSAGFTNVTAIPLNDLNMFSQKKNGQVKEVTINGNTEFEEGDIFPKNSNVLITYHSK